MTPELWHLCTATPLIYISMKRHRLKKEKNERYYLYNILWLSHGKKTWNKHRILFEMERKAVCYVTVTESARGELRANTSLSLCCVLVSRSHVLLSSGALYEVQMGQSVGLTAQKHSPIQYSEACCMHLPETQTTASDTELKAHQMQTDL